MRTVYSKSKALQMWLIGYEFPETVIAVCSRSIHILTSKKKVSYLKPTRTENAVLHSSSSPSKTDKDAANYALLAALQASHAGKTVATLGKEQPLGDFAGGWRAALGGSGLAQVELAPALTDLLAVKDSSEASASSVRRSSRRW